MFIATTRFNEKTWQENSLWRERNEHSGCIYNLSKQINENIPIDSVLFILEMNNTKNKIMGIGVIKNRCDPNYHFIYADQMYNRYTYKSNYRIDRSQLTENEKLTIQRIEYFIFKGYKHLKRGQGITLLPSQLCHSKGQGNNNTVEYDKTNYLPFLRSLFKNI